MNAGRMEQRRCTNTTENTTKSNSIKCKKNKEKLEEIEQPYSVARFATPCEYPHRFQQRIEIFNVLEFFNMSFFENFGENPKKNVISRKLQGFEQP